MSRDGSIRRGRQHAAPLHIDRLDEGGTAQLLAPLQGSPHGDRHDEAWLQRLIARFPQVLPIQEVETGFARLVPVCLELPTPAGYPDNFFITERGDLVLVECKLWRNPEARREVVAQIIDYAHAMASWTYSDLEAAIQRAVPVEGERPPVRLYDLVEEHSDFDEMAFVDAVSRNLRLGRVLLLIIGDGIREGVESLADYLQVHAGFHFTLGLVEMTVFQLPAGGFVVQPRVLARTVNIERGIVRLLDPGLTVQAPPALTPESADGRRTSISQDRLMEILSDKEPGLPAALSSFLERVADLGVYLEAATKSLQLRWQGPDDLLFALGAIDQEANFQSYNVNWAADGVGQIELAHAYLGELAGLLGGEVRKTPKPTQWHVVLSGTIVPKAMDLLSREREWATAIENYTDKLMKALESTG